MSSAEALAGVILANTSWRDAVNFLSDLLDCTRLQAAKLIAMSMMEGYLTE